MIPFNTSVPGAAGTTTYEIVPTPLNAKVVRFQGKLTAGTAGGTTCKAYLQTTFDGGLTWQDVACLAFATTTVQKLAVINRDIVAAVRTAISDGALADDTIANGLIGHAWRLKLIVVGTYPADNLLRIDANFE